MKKIIFSLLFGCMALPMTAGQISGKIKVNGTERSYIGHLPSKLGELRPMLISCHGMNQDAAYQKNMLSIESVADTAKFLTIFPEGIDKSWDISGDRDIKFMEAIIDEMEKKYKIDRNCVYLSGFSMGGMFTYHAMNKMADKIAAFAPISGYSMWGTTADAKVRPLPIIHTHGTSDDVVNFGGVQGALDVWIKHNGCPTKATVVKNYRKTPHITRHTWGPGKNGVEVVLMEMADKGHWIANDYGVKTGEEIWNFCKRYGLVEKNPKVKFSTTTKTYTYITFGGSTEIPAMTLEATASDPDGQVASVAFYNGTSLLAQFDTPPYVYELSGLGKGTHKIRAVVTDDEGRTSSDEITIKATEPAVSSYISLHQSLKQAEGGIPEGWTAYDGKNLRLESTSGYTSGSRVIHLTNTKRDFEWGFYTRNTTGNPKDGYVRFGGEGTQTTLTFYPGHYQLGLKISNWNKPEFSPVTIAIEHAGGDAVCSEEYMPTSNIGNSASKAFSGTTTHNYEFDITEAGQYVITFYTADAQTADLVLGQANLYYKGKLAGIQQATTATPAEVRYYSLSGQKLDGPSKGCYIMQTIGADGTKTARVMR